jgi:hypothetical protein
MGRFKQSDVDQLLVDCHRRCCICHRFCGVKIETDHIVPEGEGGPSDISNAIAVCFECHAEIHSYNDQHPRGRKFRPEELKKHKEQWLAICRDKPSELLTAARNADVGPLQALVDELAFNLAVAKAPVANANVGICPFMMEQMKRAITEGTLSMVDDKLRQAIINAYHHMNIANHALAKSAAAPAGAYFDADNSARDAVRNSAHLIESARDALLSLLGSSE